VESVLKKKKKGCDGKDLQEKGGFKSGMKERVGDGKLIMISLSGVRSQTGTKTFSVGDRK